MGLGLWCCMAGHICISTACTLNVQFWHNLRLTSSLLLTCVGLDRCRLASGRSHDRWIVWLLWRNLPSGTRALLVHLRCYQSQWQCIWTVHCYNTLSLTFNFPFWSCEVHILCTMKNSSKISCVTRTTALVTAHVSFSKPEQSKNTDPVGALPHAGWNPTNLPSQWRVNMPNIVNSASNTRRICGEKEGQRSKFSLSPLLLRIFIQHKVARKLEMLHGWRVQNRIMSAVNCLTTWGCGSSPSTAFWVTQTQTSKPANSNG